MSQSQRFLGVIPARAGSKGIRNKNSRPFCGKPLLQHLSEAAKKSRYIDRLVLSTESLEIANLAEKFGIEVPVLRPASLAGDTSNVVDAVLHLLSFLRIREKFEPEYLVLLQLTSPFRTTEDIDATIELLLKRNADSAITVCPAEPRVYCKRDDDSLILLTKKQSSRNINRQTSVQAFRENGCMVYVNRVAVLKKTRSFLGGKLVGQVIPRWRGVDLDDGEDFVVGEILFNNHKTLDRKIRRFH